MSVPLENNIPLTLGFKEHFQFRVFISPENAPLVVFIVFRNLWLCTTEDRTLRIVAGGLPFFLLQSRPSSS
jgi:hypothetical protein